MYRIDNPTAATTLPTPGVATGVNGFFTGGVPGTTAATTVDADWLNAVQETVATPITDAGLTLNKADNTQLAQAIGIIGRRSIAFETSGVFTVPPGVTSVRVRLWGAGAGGGGAYGAGSAGSAGGGGGYSEGFISGLTPGAAIAVSVGIGGAAGNGSPSAGSPGGTSSFGGYISASGGGGGYGGNAGIQESQFGAGGVGTGGALNITGSAGGYAYASSNSVIVQAVGGGTFCTSNTNAGIAMTGISGVFPGGGGNGGVVGGAGGAGAAGLVVIEY